MRDKIQKYFTGTINADDDAAFIGDDQFVNAENVRWGTTDKGVTGTIESIASTVMLSAAEPSVTFVEIGSAEDVPNSRFFYFLKDLYGPWDKIMCYDADRQTVYTVLRANQVTGGLGLNKSYLIHSARVVGSLLYWTDNLNQPRRINVEAAINLNHPGTFPDVDAYTNPLAEEVITIIRKPPSYPLSVVKTSQLVPALDNNFISGFSGKFAAFYDFRDGEKAVLGTYSQLINYNTKTDDDNDYNAIDITFSFGDKIEQDVERVWVAVQFGLDPNFFGIKAWDKNNATDAAAIAAHNAGTTALTYRFYNDQTGVALGTVFSTKPFDSVPRLSEALEAAENRLHLANNLEGYTSPLITSLTATIQDQTAGNTMTGNVWRLIYGGGSQTRYVIQLPIPVSSLAGYYRVTANDTIPPSSPIAYSALTFISASTTDVFKYYIPSWPVGPPFVDSFTFFNTITVTGTPNVIANAQVYKSGSTYRLAIFFWDKWRRRCGLVLNGQVYQIPDRAFDTVSFVTAINWALSNANALNEIPDWAHYYSICRTKCLRTNFFLQARSQNPINSMTYVGRDVNNEYTFNDTTFASSLYGVGVDITNLQNFGMGYQFQQGDIIKIYRAFNPTVYQLSIIDQQGQWLICELQNLGNLDPTTSALFEIFTPYKPSINEAFYEVGSSYAINNPGTASRSYSVLGGSIRGDITILDRGAPGNYYTEVMSPNDKYYKDWFTDAGQPNFLDTIGEQQKETNISFSNTLIPGTKTNGLSSFEPLNEKNLPEECGAIQKLQLTSKVQDELGVVMLAICEKETASLYLGETQQYGSNQSTTLTVSTEVIGTVNILKGSYGTMNPESVTEFRGNVFWLDVGNGEVVQYSNNGLFPISNYKMNRFWKQFCDLYLSMTEAQIEALGSRPFIFTTVDPHHMELLLSIPKLSNTPPKGYLPDYPSTIYPFDILDFQGKTIVYKLDLGNGQPKWQGAYSFNPEGFITLQNKLYSFYHGQLHQHNQTTSYNQFYGVQYKSRVMFVANNNPNMMKIFDNIRIEANMKPTLTYFLSESPHQQASDLKDFDYRNMEGFLYSTLYRNKLVPTATGYNTNGLLTAEKIRTYVLRVMLEFTVTTVPLELRFATIGVEESIGHVQK